MKISYLYEGIADAFKHVVGNMIGDQSLLGARVGARLAGLGGNTQKKLEFAASEISLYILNDFKRVGLINHFDDSDTSFVSSSIVDAVVAASKATNAGASGTGAGGAGASGTSAGTGGSEVDIFIDMFCNELLSRLGVYTKYKKRFIKERYFSTISVNVLETLSKLRLLPRIQSKDVNNMHKQLDNKLNSLKESKAINEGIADALTHAAKEFFKRRYGDMDDPTDVKILRSRILSFGNRDAKIKSICPYIADSFLNSLEEKKILVTDPEDAANVKHITDQITAALNKALYDPQQFIETFCNGLFRTSSSPGIEIDFTEVLNDASENLRKPVDQIDADKIRGTFLNETRFILQTLYKLKLLKYVNNINAINFSKLLVQKAMDANEMSGEDEESSEGAESGSETSGEPSGGEGHGSGTSGGTGSKP